MLHYTCDRCQRSISSVDSPRYVVHIDIDVVVDEDDSPTDELGPDEMGPDEFVDDEAVDYLSDLNESLETEAFRNQNVNEEEEGLDYLNELLMRGDDHSPVGELSLDPCNKTPATFPISYDLCHECYVKYSRNPLSHERALKLHFSNN